MTTQILWRIVLGAKWMSKGNDEVSLRTHFNDALSRAKETGVHVLIELNPSTAAAMMTAMQILDNDV